MCLGAIHGPTELLPVSSSAHTSLARRLCGWRSLHAEAQNAFDVALHAGTAAALLVAQRRVVAGELRRLDGRRAAAIAFSAMPPALAGYLAERAVEEHADRPRMIAAGLVIGSVAMLAADRAPQERERGDVRAVDGLALGLAQAAALFPGVSRTGAAVAAARWRRFTRGEAGLLSRTIALPVIAGAAGLKGVRLHRRAIDRWTWEVIAIGAAAAFASGLVSQGLVGLVDRDRSPWPFAAYRIALAAALIARPPGDHRRPAG